MLISYFALWIVFSTDIQNIADDVNGRPTFYLSLPVFVPAAY